MKKSLTLTFADVLLALVSTILVSMPTTLRADIVFTADPNNSSLTITASLLVASINGTVTMPLQGGNLTTRLSGVFTANPPGTLGVTQIQFTQLDTLNGNIFNPAGSPIPPANSIIGSASISNAVSAQLRIAMSGSTMSIQNGVVNYNVPLFSLSGAISLAPASLTASAPTFSNGDTQVDFNFATSPLHQQFTLSPGVVLDVSVSGHVQGGISAAPEPTTCAFLGVLSFAGAMIHQRKRLLRRK